MHKILFSILFALILALAVVGVKKMVGSNTTSQNQTLVAEGGAPRPPIPY